MLELHFFLQGFLIMYLPFNDDIRDVAIDFPIVEANDEQVLVARKVMKKLKMKHYDPEAFENPGLQSHYKLIEALALQVEDEEDGKVDSTLPPFEIQRQRLGNLSQNFKDATSPSNEVLEMVNAAKIAKAAASATTKRPSSSATGSAPKRPKVSTAPLTSQEMEFMVKNKTVHKLLVDQLKNFLISIGNSTGGKRKDDLVQEVYDYFEMAF